MLYIVFYNVISGSRSIFRIKYVFVKLPNYVFVLIFLLRPVLTNFGIWYS